MTNQKRLVGCHPDLIHKVLAIVDDLKGHGLDVVVTEGRRTLERQRLLYSQGRTKPGKIVTWTLFSNHLSGRAADLAFRVNGKITWNVSLAAWALIGKSAKAHGLIWGGNWKHGRDCPHVELED